MVCFGVILSFFFFFTRIAAYNVIPNSYVAALFCSAHTHAWILFQYIAVVVSTKCLSFCCHHACILHLSLHILCTMSEPTLFLKFPNPLHFIIFSSKLCKTIVNIATGNAPLSEHVCHWTQESLLLTGRVLLSLVIIKLHTISKYLHYVQYSI